MKKKPSFFVTVLLVMTACSAPINNRGWNLVWEENFDGPEIDSAVWTRVEKGASDWNDMMSLRSDLAFIENGELVLLGKRGGEEDDTPFVSGGVHSRGKKSFREARIEIKAKFNCVDGFWPALWLMPECALPAPTYAEVDLMEHLNADDFVYQTLHSRYTLDGNKEPAPYATHPIDKEGWNIYAAEIYRDSVCLFTNGEKTLSYARMEGVPGQFPWADYPFFFILSNQLGGSWVGPVSHPEQLPSELRIDWIKVYEKPHEPLLNGKDLSGWQQFLREGEEAEEPTFSVSDGVLHISGKPFGYIRTDKKYSNYTLHLEWRWAGPEGVDGGIYHFLQDGDKVWPSGVQMQMTPKDMGDLFGGIPIEGIEGPFYWKKRFDEQSHENPVGEWNTLEFVCRDGNIKAFLNGFFINEANCAVKEGYIGIQSEGGPMDVRNIWISSAPKEQETARPGDLIPAPVEYALKDGLVESAKVLQLPQKVKISEKALSKRLSGRELAPWQVKGAYWLEVGKKGVKIEAADEEGVFYARQSLKMMAALSSAVTCCTILDWPRFQHRGLMLDVSRHFQDQAFVEKQLEMMALLKMNRFHFHLVDNPGWRLQIDAYPKLTQLTAWRPTAYFWDWEENETGGPFAPEGTPGAYGGYYTKKDIADILAFAAERHIEVIPEIEMPGHNYETRAAYPELACSLPGGGTDAWELCPGKESTYEFLEKVLLEVFELFPGPYIHIGGDEAGKDNWKRCPECQARMKAEGLQNVEELQSYMIKRMARFAGEHGKRIIGWDEILQGGLAPDATVMSWHGTEGGVKAAAEGHDVIFTPTRYFYLDYQQDSTQYRPVGRLLPLGKVYSFEPLEGVPEADAHHILGVQGCLWTEWVQEAWHAEMMLYPRAFAISEVGWSQADKKDSADFERRARAWTAVARNMGYNVY